MLSSALDDEIKSGMRELLRSFQRGEISLSRLVVLLDSARANLLQPDASWQELYLGHWSKLEEVNALLLDEECNLTYSELVDFLDQSTTSFIHFLASDA